MKRNERLSPALSESPRFQIASTRRDWLGLAAIWSTVAGWALAAIGTLRLPMPAVFPESNAQVKIGSPEAFAKGTAEHLPDLSVWVFHDDQGFYAISSVCTHLGCIAKRYDNGEFKCPCHGSLFTPAGKVVGGPAPKGLNWLAISLSPDGQLVVDQMRTVSAGTRFQA